MAKVSAIVLAAGQSRRMGVQNKMALEFEGQPLIHHVSEQVRKSEAFETIIVTSEVSFQLFEGQSVVINENYRSGMTSSIRAGVEACSAETDGFMICLGDQPLIRTDQYNYLMKVFEEKFQEDPKVIVVPTYKKSKGNPVILSSTYREAILKHQEPEGCKGIVQNNLEHVFLVETSNSAILADIDTPEDFDREVNKSTN